MALINSLVRPSTSISLASFNGNSAMHAVHGTKAFYARIDNA
jgi:hypothetical protein